MPGHRAFYSLSGLPNSWLPIPQFSGLTVSTTALAVLNLSWNAGSNLFLLWVDDNALGSDGAYGIDNFAVTPVINTNIVITAQPQDVTIPVGYPATFSVLAEGTAPLRYQWIKDATPIMTATNASLNLGTVSEADVGLYFVEISNAYTRVTSSNASLEIGTKPVAIVVQPSPLQMAFGESGTLNVTPSGTLPQFQWFRNGAIISGATNSTYVFTATLPEEAGFYSVTVSNQLNSVRSHDVAVHLRQSSPTLVGMTNNWKYLTSGSQIGASWTGPNFDDSAWPSGPGLFGREDITAIVQLIKTTLPLTNLSGSITTYYFRVKFVLTNETQGTFITLSNLIDDGAVFYLNGAEWHRQNMPAGAVNANTFALNAEAEGVFSTFKLSAELLQPGTNILAVEVHQYGSSSSDIVFGAALNLKRPELGPAEITASPTNRAAIEGNTVVFGGEVRGTPPLSLQWFHDGIAIEGATNEILILSNVTISTGGNYQLSVSNAFTTAYSELANLYVISPVAPTRVIVAFTNSWKFNPWGTNIGNSWVAPNYNDSNWLSGPGIFANVDTAYPEPIGTFVPDIAPFQPATTVYFRTKFDAPGSNGTYNLVLSNLVDDGVIIYLNGAEISRTAFFPASIAYDTTVSRSGNPQQYLTVILANVPLLATGNVFAVEVHQTFFSSDVVFGSALREIAGTNEWAQISVEPLDVAVPLGYPATLRAEGFGSHPLSYQWFKNGAPLPGATNKILQSFGTIADDAGVYQLRVSNRFNTALSREAALTILEETNPPVALVRGPYLQNGTTNSVIVRWGTDVFSRSQVWYGTNPAALNETATVATLQTDHSVRLTDLRPNTRYYYAISTTTSNLTVGPEFSFVTVPMAGKHTRIWAQGDQGTASPQARAVVSAFTNLNQGPSADVWLLLGDNAYGAGAEDEYQRALFDFMPEVLRSTLLWSTMGNHETYSMDGNGYFPYQTIFSPPTQGEGGGAPSGSKYYYSFDYGNIHFVCLDSEISSRETNGPMATWLREDLSLNDKDWLIAFWHSPPYTRGSHNSDNMFDNGGNMSIMRENFLPILEAHGVDLVLNGHSHCYERSFLLDGHYGFSPSLESGMLKDAGTGHDSGTGAYRKPGTGPAPNEGAVYIVAGSAGQATFGSLDHPAMCVSLLKMGSLILDIDGQRLDGMFLRDNGAIEDRFTLLKSAPPEPLRIVKLQMENGHVYGTWKARAGVQYILEASAAVVGAPWIPVNGPVEATGATMTWGIAMSGDAQFYRIREVTP